MEISKSYRTLSDCISLDEMLSELRNKGYNQKLRREPTCLYCIELNIWIGPGEFNVDEQHYFGDDLRPDLDRMLCAITTQDGLKGILVDAFGVYADNTSWEMIQKFGV